ncbi:hypothetical protein AURDEDRAFT_157758 [Auricularia subglabra TFB-10046 SS5]|nr:hypothetical protein AURDEDRAFT_157758 [Auricularia subglabra TFB-10046 SS5]
MSLAKWDGFVPELLSMVQDILVDDYNQLKASAETQRLRAKRNAKGTVPTPPLAHLARVNRHWNAVARKDMYERVYVHKEQTMKLLARTLVANPDLLDLIKSFTVDYRYNNMPTQAKAQTKEKANRTRTSKVTWQVLKLLKPRTLTHLSVEEESLSPMPGGDEQSPPCLVGLTSLSVEARRYTTSDWAVEWFKVAVPTLKKFKAPTSPIALEYLKTALDKPARLTGLYLPASQTHFDNDTFKLLVGESVLEDLSFNDLPLLSLDTFTKEMNRLARNLRRLHIGATYSSSRAFPRTRAEYIEAICTMLKHCNSLEVLHVCANGEELVAPISRAIPRSVRHLVIDVDCVCTDTGGIVRNPTFEDILGATDAVLNEDLTNLRVFSVTCFRIDWNNHSHGEELARRVADATAKNIKLSYSTEFPTHLPMLYPRQASS